MAGTPDYPPQSTSPPAHSQRPTPAAVARGTVAGLAADDEGHAFALLGPPGRNSIATQALRRAALAPDARLDEPDLPVQPAGTASPRHEDAACHHGRRRRTIAWREGAKVKVERYPEGGGIAWVTRRRSPWPATSSWRRRSRRSLPRRPGRHEHPGRTRAGLRRRDRPYTRRPRTCGASRGQPRHQSAGDLFVGYGDAIPGSAAAGRRPSHLGRGHDRRARQHATRRLRLGRRRRIRGCVPSPATPQAPATCSAREGPFGFDITFRPRALSVVYGKRVAAGGYVYQDTLARERGRSQRRPRRPHRRHSAGSGASGPDGYYRVTLSPKASATWTASTAQGPSQGVRIEVRAQGHDAAVTPQASTRLSEIFSGWVTPNHKGKKVLVAEGRRQELGRRSRLASSTAAHATRHLVLPYKTATCKLRVAAAAHGDDAQGTSPTGTLRVKIEEAERRPPLPLSRLWRSRCL